MDPLSILIILSALFTGWCIGANSASNAMSALSGLRILGYRSAAVIVSLLILAGALLQSGPVMKTVGEGVIAKDFLVNDKKAVLSVLITTALLMGFLTWKALPVSSSQAIIGGLVGLGLFMGASGYMDFFLILKIFVSWCLTPVISLVLAMAFYKFFTRRVSKRMGLVRYGETFKLLVIFGTGFVAYAVGANNAGNAAGLLISPGIVSDGTTALVAVALVMGFGVASYGRKVARTVGRNITPIDPVTVFTSQVSAGFTVYFFTLFGIPVSASQALIGGLVGVGATKGFGMINKGLVYVIFLEWFITPVSAAILSMFTYSILSVFLF